MFRPKNISWHIGLKRIRPLCTCWDGSIGNGRDKGGIWPPGQKAVTAATSGKSVQLVQLTSMCQQGGSAPWKAEKELLIFLVTKCSSLVGWDTLTRCWYDKMVSDTPEIYNKAVQFSNSLNVGWGIKLLISQITTAYSMQIIISNYCSNSCEPSVIPLEIKSVYIVEKMHV